MGLQKQSRFLCSSLYPAYLHAVGDSRLFRGFRRSDRVDVIRSECKLCLPACGGFLCAASAEGFLLVLCGFLSRTVRLLIEEYLRIQRSLSGFALNTVVVTLAVLLARLYIITQAGVEYVHGAVRKPAVQQRRCDLDAALGVSGHEIRAGDVYPAARILAENVDTAVFQESPYNGYHADILCVAFNSGDKAAYSPDD